jgi:Ca2+-transporting ATPase
MGPTCSIIYENEPMEKNTMSQNPKALTTTFFNWKELSISIIQGLVITIGTLFVYRYSVINGYDEALTRTMTFTVLIAANIFLTLINRSFYYSILTTLKYKNNMVLFIIFITIAIVALILYVKPLTNFFEFETLNLLQLLTCIAIGFISVIWFEIVKLAQRAKRTPAIKGDLIID